MGKNVKADYTAEAWARYLDTISTRRKERRKNDPEYAQRMRDQQRESMQRRRADPAFIVRLNAKRQERKQASLEEHKARERVRGLARRGFSAALVGALREVQGGKCAVCRALLTSPADTCADHCHDSNKARGLLCPNCNLAEGFIKKTGLPAVEFGVQLQRYLDNPPAVVASAAMELAG